MRKILISAAAAAAVALSAAPAAAQSRDYDRGWGQRDHDRWGDRDRYDRRDRRAVYQLMRELDRAESQIQRAYQRRHISQREAQSLHREASHLRQRLHRASRDGLSQREYYELQQRINRLEQRIRYERRDRDGRRW